VVPGEGAALQVWILGSSGGESAEVAGDEGLRLAAKYHVSPATVLEAVDGYRAAFRPSAVLGRIDTQFTGTPSQVADQLERLRDGTEADELIITTITHDHADRVRSYQLLAEEWARRCPSAGLRHGPGERGGGPVTVIPRQAPLS
jgi:alkanesulfonate monooxygenase SsuD/methylene tetrahydromethanopterin reductase-like flavin-dependent oxidoreductase (luciferase family)